MNSKALLIVLCLLLVAVRGKSVSIGSGFQTQTLTKRIKTHSEQPIPQNEDSSKTTGKNSEEKSNVKNFLKWKLYVQLKLNHRVKSISHIETPGWYKTGARMRKTLPKYTSEFN